ncbi:hypothetical protein MKZ38_003979 [Zalerion maritima]|uniref:Uncharacterized protein n=1 Tax=Zalerion maritima TaxID=339359 RepID=A0AAD5WRC5_9PEZI|nr:hypothetical protein MKZ38_003979 [Zalerion maritima]
MAPMAHEPALPPEPEHPRPRSSRSLHPDDREQSFEDDTEDEGKATVELAAIMTTSTPVTPGPSSPPLEVLPKPQDFAPPTRPSSTPFPHPEPKSDNIHYARHTPDGSHHPDGMDLSPELGHDGVAEAEMVEPCAESVASLESLPNEMHECIIDHLFGYRVSPTSKSSVGMHRVTTSISTMLRHSRRKELSQLACINPLYRSLVQERLFRHIKIKASISELDQAAIFFLEHSHLRDSVKHIEIWFPVFQPKFATSSVGAPMALPTITDDGFALTTYTLPTDNASLEEVFYFVGTTFPDVQVLTLEGGDRRKAPKVKHCRNGEGVKMSPIGSVKTLVTKGQWNLIRSHEDFKEIISALPSIEEWHGSYSKPKSKGYLTMAPILQNLPCNLTRLNICLEADYRREATCPSFFLKVMAADVHLCTRLALASPALEHISYTGRVCHTFFDVAAKLADPRATRLKSIELHVKNCCRRSSFLHDSGSGITDMSFINAFEQLVLSAIRSMERLTALEFLRIRYIDLDSPVPPLNPFFTLNKGWCSGVWSEKILAELSRVRPRAKFEQLSESFGDIGFVKDGRMLISPDYPRQRVLSLRLANYSMLQGAIAATT